MLLGSSDQSFIQLSHKLSPVQEITAHHPRSEACMVYGLTDECFDHLFKAFWFFRSI